MADFDQNWVFPKTNFSFDLLMALKWSANLEVALKRCPIVLQVHLPNLKVTQLKQMVGFDSLGA